MIKKIIWLIIAGLIIVYTLPKLLERVSLFFTHFSQTSHIEENIFVLPPVLDALPEATNSASIKITGYAEGADSVEIFVNDISKKSFPVSRKDGRFSIQVSLYEGDNTIKAVSLVNKKISKSSDVQHVFYRKEGPKLIIDSPQEDEEIIGNDARVTIRGLTEKDVDVRINNRWVKIHDDGSFIQVMPLNEGENSFTITAQDPAGNTSVQTLRVTYRKE